uniref:Putative secreted protein n=1 Tax=Anopheles darlingi TaxID=43151 RepID=A0A2M4DJN5_ANODA
MVRKWHALLVVFECHLTAGNTQPYDESECDRSLQHIVPDFVIAKRRLCNLGCGDESGGSHFLGGPEITWTWTW